MMSNLPLSIPFQFVRLDLFACRLWSLSSLISFERFSHIEGILATIVIWTTVILVDSTVILISEFLIHFNGHLVAGSYEQIHEKCVMNFGYPLKIIHQKTSESLFSTLRCHSDGSDMSVPLIFVLFALYFAHN